MRKEQLKTLLATWRDDIVPAARGMMNNLFKSAGEVMLEYADKAESNAIQVRFFEGKR